jgi:hypothetical protein
MRTRPWTRLLAAATIALTMTTSGCAVRPPPEPDPDPTCRVRDTGDTVDEKYDPFSGTRPPAVPFGWGWVVVTLEVRALPPVDSVEPRYDQCVPVSVHVYGTQEGIPALTIFANGAPHQLPYDANMTTPWVGTYFVLAYDPNSPRFYQRAPKYSLVLRATYQADRDFGDSPPTALSCAIRIAAGFPVKEDLVILNKFEKGFVNCSFEGNTYTN